MGIDHTQPAYTDEAAPFIQEHGGKMGGLAFLRTRGGALQKAILPSQIVPSDQEWHGANVEAGMDDKYIVRASHPHDFQGLVDVVGTQVVHKETDIGNVIDRMRAQARSASVMAYGQYENPEYDGKISVGIQPYLQNRRGSVVEHPNRPGEYVVSYVNDHATGNMSGLEIDTAMYNASEDTCKRLGGERIEKEKAKVIADLYKLIEGANLVQEGMAFQVEFLDDGRSLVIAQVRAFTKKRVADFTLEGRQRLVFGVTPKEGVELPVLQSPNGYDRDRQPLSHPEPWAFLKTQHDELLNLDFQPKDMKAFLISQSWMSGITTSLEHHHFRYAQKADVTVFEDQCLHRHDFSRLIYGEDDFEMLNMRMRNLEAMAMLSGRYQIEVEREMLHRTSGLLPTKVKIVSDGRTATVDPVIPNYDDVSDVGSHDVVDDIDSDQDS